MLRLCTDLFAVDPRAAGRTLEEDDVLLIEVFCGRLVRWRHAVAVGEPVGVHLHMGLGVGTEARRMQMGLELEGAAAL